MGAGLHNIHTPTHPRLAECQLLADFGGEQRLTTLSDGAVIWLDGDGRWVPADSAVERFWRHVQVTDESQCWLWTASTAGPTGFKYGQFAIGRFGGRRGPVVTIRAHRFSYILTHGRLSRDLFICHRCDTPACVNPAHLFAGSALDNFNDMRSKGRWNHPYSSRRNS